MKQYPLLKGFGDENYLSCSLQKISESPKKSGVFQYGLFSIFKARLPHNYQLDIFLQSLNLMPPTSVVEVIEKIIEVVALCRFLMD